MSTKCTIGYGPKHHLYEECFDPDRVWLRLDNAVPDMTLVEGQVTVGIDIKIWREIVEAWMKSHWANHPERDYQRESAEAFEASNAWLESLITLKD
jgi:hypothetical protein